MRLNSNLEVKRTYTVDGVEFDSKEDAKRELALRIINSTVPGGVDEVIKNAKEVISALRVLSRD